MANAAADPEVNVVAELYKELRGTLLGFLFKQTGDAQVAEDLLHDVMLKVLANQRDGLARPRKFSARHSSHIRISAPARR